MIVKGTATRYRHSCRALFVAGFCVLFSSCNASREETANVLSEFGGLGLGDGRFSYPRGIAAAPDGCIFVVDKTGRVQRFSAEGKFETSWRMPISDAGKPVGLKVHPDGRLFVADTHYHRVMIFDRDGKQLGEFGSLGDGDGQFQLPTDIAFDAKGFIYVSEYYANDRITKWSPDFTFIKSFGREPIEGKQLSRPTGLIIDNEQTLWTADACNHRLVRYSLDGEVLRVIGQYGREPGQMRYPYDISLTPEGNLLVCEYEGNRLQWLTKEGRPLQTWGTSGRKPGELWAPWGATYGPNGLVYACDSLNERVQIVKP